MNTTDTSTDSTTDRSTDRQRYRKRALVAGVAGLAIAGGVFASAASLGGVSSTSLGSSNTVVASCDTDGVTISYDTQYDASGDGYHVGQISLEGIDDSCAGKHAEITLEGPDNVKVTTDRLAVKGNSMRFQVTGFPGESVERASVLIEG